MRVLVTGGAGFIGSHTVDSLIGKGHEVAIIDNFFSGMRENVNPGAEMHEEDIANTEKVREIVGKFRPESVLHLAASVSVSRSAKDPLMDARVNIEGTLSLYSALLEAAREGVLKKIVVASSQTTYGEGLHLCESCGKEVKPGFRKPKDLAAGRFDHYCPACSHYPLKPIGTPENLSQDPAMPYGISKLAEEKYLLAFAQMNGIDGIAMRYFNVYGPRQTSQGMEASVSAIFFNRLLHGKQPEAFEDGRQMRDFVHVRDVARANLLVLEKARGIKRYNIGKSPVEIAGLGEMIARKLGLDIRTRILNKARCINEGSGTYDTRSCIADTSLVKEELGFEASIDMDEGLSDTAEWAGKNKELLIK